MGRGAKKVDVKQLHQGDRFEQQNVAFERAEVDALANVIGGDVSNIVNKGCQKEKDWIHASNVPNQTASCEIKHASLTNVSLNPIKQVCLEIHVPCQEMFISGGGSNCL